MSAPIHDVARGTISTSRSSLSEPVLAPARPAGREAGDDRTTLQWARGTIPSACSIAAGSNTL
ncbi:hypothetical protein, partial [Mizugakiibacter sediminis]|uniref:hypothetical protein n=1 Tax=Mizugakiibacter sediminis TaxID=1475481 RepID=UPI001F44EF85